MRNLATLVLASALGRCVSCQFLVELAKWFLDLWRDGHFCTSVGKIDSFTIGKFVSWPTTEVDLTCLTTSKLIHQGNEGFVSDGLKLNTQFVNGEEHHLVSLSSG